MTANVPLVSPAALAALLADPPAGDPPVLLDVRWRLLGPPGREDHERAHLPGAVFVDLDAELAGVRRSDGAGGRHPLPDPSRLQPVLRAAGVRSGSTVVAFDDDDGSVAARLWWTLRWAGLPADRVAVLDGGFAAWVAEGRPVTAERARPVPGDVTVRPGGMPVLDADGAAEVARRGVLLDARAPQRYRGEVEPVDPRPGHIPGARSAPATGNVGADGRWHAPEVLAERFEALGIGGGGPVGGGEAIGAYCGSGVNAAALVLALEVSGLTADRPAALYVGSWSDWSSDPERPAATGATP